MRHRFLYTLATATLLLTSGVGIAAAAAPPQSLYVLVRSFSNSAGDFVRTNSAGHYTAHLDAPGDYSVCVEDGSQGIRYLREC